MNKQDYIKIINEKISGSAKDILLKQVDLFFDSTNNFKQAPHNYKKGDLIRLDKGTLLHGTYKNIEGLEKIAKEGLICDLFSSGRKSKYPMTVGVWNLKKDYLLKDYINFYIVGTIMFKGESFNEVCERMYFALQSVLKKYKGKKIFIVSHGTAISVLFSKIADVFFYDEENYNRGIYFNGKLIFDGKCDAPELFKLEYEDEKLVDVKNIKIKY